MTPLRVWKAAARIRTLPAAITPVMVGGGLAAHDGVFRWDAFSWALVGAVSIQVAANFANDASDARRGVDTEDRLGPPRMVATGAVTARGMWVATTVALLVAAVAGIALTLVAGPWIVVIGIVSVAAMLGYVGGPVPYGYRGLGEISVFLFFGFVATVGSRFVHDSTAPLSAWLMAIPVGMLATAILVANNYRDIETDSRSGKRTLAVMLGPARTRLLFATLTYGAFPVIVLFAVTRWTPFGTLFGALWVPLSTGPVSIIQSRNDGPSLIRALELTGRLHLLTGLSLAAGATLSM